MNEEERKIPEMDHYLEYTLDNIWCKKCNTNIFSIKISNDNIWIICCTCEWLSNIGTANESIEYVVKKRTCKYCKKTLPNNVKGFCNEEHKRLFSMMVELGL